MMITPRFMWYGDCIMAASIVDSLLKFIEGDMRRHFDDGLTCLKVYLNVRHALNAFECRFHFLTAPLTAHSRNRIGMFHVLPNPVLCKLQPIWQGTLHNSAFALYHSALPLY